MAFGSLVPGMAPMPMPQMQPNKMAQQGLQIMNMARQQQRQAGGQPGQAPQGLLQRLLNPAAPGPMDLAAPGMPPNAGPPAPGGGNPMQMGLLAKLFPQLMGGGMPGGMPGGAPAPIAPPVAPTGLGGLY